MAHAGLNAGTRGLVLPSLLMLLAWRSAWLVLLRAHLLVQAAATQCGAQRDCGPWPKLGRALRLHGKRRRTTGARSRQCLAAEH